MTSEEAYKKFIEKLNKTPQETSNTLLAQRLIDKEIREQGIPWVKKILKYLQIS